MSNTLTINPIQEVQAVTAQTANFAPHGNIFTGSVGAVTSNQTMIFDSSGNQRQINLSKEFYNLFVVKNEMYVGQSGSFIISKERAVQYRALSEAAKAEATLYPSLFMDTNKAYRRCAVIGQQFYYGIITHVYEQGKFYKVHFQKISVQSLLQQQLNDNAVRLGINTNNGQDSLDETGWKIIKLDLRKALMEVGIYL